MGVMEMSHRGKEFVSIYKQAEKDMRDNLGTGLERVDRREGRLRMGDQCRASSRSASALARAR